MALSLGNTLNTLRNSFNTVDSAASTVSNIASRGASTMQGGTEAASTEAQTQGISNQMNRTTLAAALMQLQQALCAALANVMKSGASNVKSAAQGG
ncbi:hypothetical protein G4D37_11635 [Burkholderia pseudomallei]|uniref:hypothetical protein n=1 Tax=Burkholderia pseudomallei TaxID=28450 RepID=UPI001593D221|nr:hypothetical protein [Burkholderia pseudomallei]MBF3497331.1 hypothetical protein [Burkholderia pseudomallei]NVH66901.1 hypothetical protein [Burkholderia pseudomallei]